MKYTVTSVIDDAQLIAHVSESEFVVVTKLANANFDHFGACIDKALNGLLTRTADGWDAAFGTYRLLYLPSLRAELGSLKYVLLFGLGEYSHFDGRRLCAFTCFAYSTAARCAAKRITFLESPYRSTGSRMSLAGAAATMRCRAEQLQPTGHLRELDTIEWLACPQAKPHLLAGLEAPMPRCRVCTSPQIL